MKKKFIFKTTLIYFLMVLLIPIVMALDECKGTMLINEIPCEVLLSYTGDCTTIGIKFYNRSTLLDDRLMLQYSPFSCNQTFNYTGLGTYSFNFSTGDSGTITLEEDDNQQYYLYLVSFIIFFILVGAGYHYDIDEFIMVAGILAMIIGINLFNNSFPNLINDFLKNSIVVVIWGVGAYLILAPAMKFFEEWRDKE